MTVKLDINLYVGPAIFSLIVDTVIVLYDNVQRGHHRFK